MIKQGEFVFRVMIKIYMDKQTLVVSVYDEIAQAYCDKYFEFTSEDLPHLERFIKLLPKGARVLDVGCGPGGGVKYLLSQGFNAEGIDLSPKMIQLARAQVPNGKFSLMDMMSTEYPSDIFDGLMANYSLIHVPTADLANVLSELRRILKNGGKMLILSMIGQRDSLVDVPLAPHRKVFINLPDMDIYLKMLEKIGFSILYFQEAEVLNLDGSLTKGFAIICKKDLRY